MAINKVIFGNETLVDLTDATALANDVVSGKTFYGKDGVLTTGLLGSGLTYETGTFIPSEDIHKPTISFSNAHSTLPVIVLIFNIQEQPTSTPYLMGNWCYIDSEKIFGGKTTYNSSVNLYGFAYYSAINASGWATISTEVLMNSSDNPGDQSSSYPRYYVNEREFKPSTSNNRHFFGKDLIYKWLAIWK